MTRQDFMLKLNGALARLKPEERREILADFEEHFANGLAGGKSEEEVARDLGDPAALAAQYTEGLPEPKPQVKASGVAVGILATIALLIFDAIIAIPILATLFAIWITLWSVVLCFLAVGLALMVAPFLSWLLPSSVLAGVGAFLLGIAFLALAVLSGIGMVYVSKWCYKGVAAYVKAHIRIIKGGTLA
jgi:uncharacterized membrane protein